jgi:hypothetical protein
MAFEAGRSEVRFKDVAATIVPESVQFHALKPEDGATVIEQNYEFDLVSADKLLDKYIDRKIGIVTQEGDLIEGTLLSADANQLVLAGAKGVELIPRYANVKDLRFSALPGGLLTQPTLLWMIEAKQAGDHLVQVAYRADQVTWRVDYRAVVDADGNHVDLSGWVTVNNTSGRSYEDARLKLMAGDVNVVEDEQRYPPAVPARPEVQMKAMRREAQFTEKAFSEYHLYELPRRTTIKDRQVKQIELMDVVGIPVVHAYEYRGEGDRVRIICKFKNEKKVHDGLGIPLPKGPIRVYRRDADEQTEFFGRDEIDHTPKNEEVKVQLGYAFEIKGEREQLGNRRPSTRTNDQDWRVRVRNHTDAAVKVDIVETTQRPDWEILKSSHDYKKTDYRTITYPVVVPANGEVVVTYTIRLRW